MRLTSRHLCSFRLKNPFPSNRGGESIQEQEGSLSLSQEEELRGKLSLMEARLATVQEQLTHLALSLVQERDLRYERRIAALEALVVQPLEQGRSSQELQERVLPSKLVAGDRLVLLC